MLFRNPRRLLSEEATADLLATDSQEVKDVVEDLEDTLTNNIEVVDDKDKTTNGGIPVVSESVNLYAPSRSYGRAKYLVRLEDVMAVQEADGDAAAAAEAPTGTPTPDEAEAAEPSAGDVVEDIAAANHVDPDQVAVVITAESVSDLSYWALQEAKCGARKKKAKALKKLKKTKKAISQLESAGVKIVVSTSRR